MNRSVPAAVCFATLMLFTASPALAINTTCANREMLLVGTSASVSIGASSSAFYSVALTAGRSYLVLVWQPFQDASEGLAPADISVFSDGACATAASGVTDVSTEEPFVASGSGGVVDLEAVAILPGTSGEHVIQVAHTGAAAVTHRVVITETTLYSPWWFLGAPNQAFITISNRSNVANLVFVTMNGPNGAQCGTTTAAIPPNGNTFVSVGSFAPCVAAGSGSAQLAFAGTPGSIQANTTVINATAGTSFDEPFVPRIVWNVIER